MKSHRGMRALAVVTIALGMAGLHFAVDYSGWVLFTGLLWAFSA